MQAVTGTSLLLSVHRCLIEEAPFIARKRLLDQWREEQGLAWSYRQANTWLLDCLNPERPHRLPFEITVPLVRVLGHTRFLDPLLRLERHLELERRARGAA